MTRCSSPERTPAACRCRGCSLSGRERNVRTLRLSALLILCALAVQGCCAPPVALGRALDDEALALRLRASLETLYPAGFRAVHRAVLAVRGRQMTFNGFLLAKGPGHIRLVAAADMAGTVFELVRRPDGRARVLRAAPGLPASRLGACAARDAAAIYFARPGAAAVLTQFDTGAVGFVEVLPDRTRRVFVFDPKSNCLTAYTEADRRGRRRYRIEFSDTGVFPDWPRATPRQIKIVDRVRKYELSIRVVELRPTTLADSSFEER